MIDWAFSMNYRISVADGTVGEEWHLTPVSSYAELEERWIAFAWDTIVMCTHIAG
jgi:hypothetical protein